MSHSCEQANLNCFTDNIINIWLITFSIHPVLSYLLHEYHTVIQVYNHSPVYEEFKDFL